VNKQRQQPDCVIIGYNEMPFPRFEQAMRQFGLHSPAYRDLKFSFVDVEGSPHTWVDLLNRTEQQARRGLGTLDRFTEYRCGDIPNLAAVYLTNFLRLHGLSAEYVNLFQFERDWLCDLLANSPVCVAITTTFYVTNHPATEIVDFVRQHNDKVPIVIGGPLIANHVRRYHDQELEMALDDLGSDIYIVESQGEETLRQVVEKLKLNGSLIDVPNLILAKSSSLLARQSTNPLHVLSNPARPESGYIRTSNSPENNSLDDNSIRWASTLRNDAGATLQTRTARSCAFKCAFCAYPTRAGVLTLASMDTVRRELDSMREYGGIQNLVFVDDTFNVPLPRFKQLCRLMIECGSPFRWYSYFRCNNSDAEAIELMRRSGCAGVFLGIESGSQRILNNMNKASTVEQYRTGVRMLREHDILTFGSFILGFPGETSETVQETVDFINSVTLDYYRVQLWYCEPGTPIDHRREDFKLVGTGFNWQHATMDVKEAMTQIETAFRKVDTCWLPQWSFDFWILPYLAGRGIPMGALKRYLTLAHQLLRLELDPIAVAHRHGQQRQTLNDMAGIAGEWCGRVTPILTTTTASAAT
jgi:radical SAM PhpK family P-methyltransferase